MKTLTPSKGPVGSLYVLEGKKRVVHCRTQFGNRLIEEPVASALYFRQVTLYRVIRALTTRLLILMGLSLVAGLALGYWGSR